MVAAQRYRTAAPGYARRGHRRSGGRASGLGAGAVQPHRARQLLQARAVVQAGLVLGVGRFLLRQARGLCALGLQLCHALAYLRHGGQSGFFALYDGIGALAEICRAHVQHLVAVDISNKARGKSPGDMLGTLGQSIAIMGQKLGQAELARADVVIRPQVLDIGSADFSQRANAILEGEKAALAVMPQIRERVAQLQAERAKAQRAAEQKAAEAQQQACLEQRSSLQKLVDMASLGTSCTPAK